MDKDTKAVLKALKEAGFEISKSKNGHPMVYKDEKLITTFLGLGERPAIVPEHALVLEASGIPVASTALI